MKMLEQLDRINWTSLSHALGNASDIPELLRATLSHKEAEREDAFEVLHESVCHQVTLCEASAYVVPFLWEMIQSDGTPDKDSVVNLLGLLSKASSLVMVGKDLRRTFRKLAEKDDRGLNGEGLQELEWARQTREKILQKLPLLYSYFQNGDADMKWCAARVFQHYPECAHETVPLMEAALKIEIDAHLEDTIRTAITSLKVDFP